MLSLGYGLLNKIQVFDTIKKLVTQSPILAYYDPDAGSVLQCDANQNGLGATLLQNDRPVPYASRALTKTEKKFAQIEKGALSVVFWTVQISSLYIFKTSHCS